VKFSHIPKFEILEFDTMAVSPTTPKYLKWSEVPITFDRIVHPDFVPKPGQYPLIVCSIVKDCKLN
jgi:hypothetical protein